MNEFFEKSFFGLMICYMYACHEIVRVKCVSMYILCNSSFTAEEVSPQIVIWGKEKFRDFWEGGTGWAWSVSN